MANTWWVVIPSVDQGQSVGRLEQVDFRVQYDIGSPGDRAMRTGHVYHDPNFNQDVVKWKGPFATEDQAKKAQNPKQQSPNPVTDLTTAAKDSNTFAGLAAIGDFFQRLTQASTWVRVGQVVLGLGLIIVGLAKLAEGTPIGRAAAKAGKVAAIL